SADPSAARASVRLALTNDLERRTEPQKTIHGRLLDDVSGRPIAGAVISDGRGAQTRSGPNGEYSLRLGPPTPPALPVVVSAEAPGFAILQGTLLWAEMPGSLEKDVRLPQAVLFGGRVVDAKGGPVDGADLSLVVYGRAFALQEVG